MTRPPENRFHPRQLIRRVVGIWGTTGSGKTQCARALSRDFRRRMIFDPAIDLTAGEPGSGADVHCIAKDRMGVLDYLDGIKAGDGFSIAYQPEEPEADLDDDRKVVERFEAEELNFLAKCAIELQDCAVIVDEAADPCSRSVVGHETLALGKRGRHQKIHLVLISQRPTDIDTRLRGLAYADEVYLFRLGRRADLDDLAKERGGRVAELVGKLPDLQAVRVRNVSGGVELRRIKIEFKGNTPVIVEQGLIPAEEG